VHDQFVMSMEQNAGFEAFRTVLMQHGVPQGIRDAGWSDDAVQFIRNKLLCSREGGKIRVPDGGGIPGWELTPWGSPLSSTQSGRRNIMSILTTSIYSDMSYYAADINARLIEQIHIVNALMPLLVRRPGRGRVGAHVSNLYFCAFCAEAVRLGRNSWFDVRASADGAGLATYPGVIDLCARLAGL
jgi:hypothetical protein